MTDAATEPVRYRLTVAYDGTNFCGWQKQEPALRADAPTSTTPVAAYSIATPLIESSREGRAALRTVQGVLERTIREVCREPAIELLGASRTDSGVHARGQTAAFTSRPDGKGSGWPAQRGPERLMSAINSRLPEDLVITAATQTHGNFDPIADCTSKGYSYTFHIARERPLWDRQYVHHVWHERGLDIAAMNHAAAMLVGEHDFAAFAAAGHGRLTTVRTVHTLAVRDVSDQTTPPGTRVRLDISGSGFLWNMVRIIGGTLLQVGLHQRTPADVLAALVAKDRALAGPTLPPTGLCLEWIKYGEADATSPPPPPNE